MSGFNKGKENNYHDNRKENRIFTPEIVAKRIHTIIADIYPEILINRKNILDMCCGNWNLSKWFIYNSIFGIDIVQPYKKIRNSKFILSDYLKDDRKDKRDYTLIMCNPPFNNKEKGSKLLLPFEFLKKILNDFPDKPLVLFAPHGLLNNNEIFGKKYKQKVEDAKNDNELPRYKWMQKNIHKLNSMLILPKDAFVENRYMGTVVKKDKETGAIISEKEVEKGILVHSFVTFWNMPKLESFYTL